MLFVLEWSIYGSLSPHIGNDFIGLFFLSEFEVAGSSYNGIVIVG